MSIKQKVTIVSECSDIGRKKSQAILDKYLFRTGRRTWSGKISNEGLSDLKTELSAKAKNNGISVCATVHSRKGDFIAWIVGHRDNFMGNRTPVSISRQEWYQNMTQRTVQHDILINITTLSGYLHDIGKTNDGFQNMLRGSSQHNKCTDNIRHEFLSFLVLTSLANGFVNKPDVVRPNDNELVENLSQLTLSKLRDHVKAAYAFFNEYMLKYIHKDKYVFKIEGENINLFKNISLLILSHHKFPGYVADKQNAFNIVPYIKKKDKDFTITLEGDNLSNTTKSKQYNFFSDDSNKYISLLIAKIQEIGIFFKNNIVDIHNVFPGLFEIGYTFLTMNDHYVSSQIEESRATLSNCNLYANKITKDNKKLVMNQKLDYHLYRIGTLIKKSLRQSIILNDFMKYYNSIETCTLDSKVISPKQLENKFDWQYFARKSVEKSYGGFIGFVVAGTGSGKTIGNLSILSGLPSNQDNMRITTALGLRSLTLQSGNVIKNIVSSEDNERVAIHIGDEIIRKITEIDNQGNVDLNVFEDVDIEDMESDYKDNIQYIDEILSDNNFETNDLIQTYVPKDMYSYICSPFLVTTADSLVSVNKRKYIIMRLMTSDLILDEFDNYDLEDQLILLKLIKMSASFGRKIIISSATLPVETAKAIMQSYYLGYKQYTYLNGLKENIHIGFFSENKNFIQTKECETLEIGHSFYDYMNNGFANSLNVKPAIRKGELLSTFLNERNDNIVDDILDSCYKLHQYHHESYGNINFSMGFLRIGTIKNTIKVSQELVSQERVNRFQNLETLYFIIPYHSRQILVFKDKLEKWLNIIGNRKTSLNEIFDMNDKLLDHEIPSLKNLFLESEKKGIKNIMFLLVASTIEEVGRDHDFDYMIHSPSGMQPLIQSAGRVQRHREKEGGTNIILLDRPIFSENKEHIFQYPGVETPIHPDVSLLFENALGCKKQYTIAYDDNNSITEQVFPIEDIRHNINAFHCLVNSSLEEAIIVNKEHDKINDFMKLGLLYIDAYQFSSFQTILRFRRSKLKILFYIDQKENQLTFFAEKPKSMVQYDTNVEINDTTIQPALINFNSNNVMKDFNLYHNKYFKNMDKDNLKRTLLSISVEAYNDIDTINRKYIYCPILGFYPD